MTCNLKKLNQERRSYLWEIFSWKCTTTMCTPSTICIDNNFTPSQTTVSLIKNFLALPTKLYACHCTQNYGIEAKSGNRSQIIQSNSFKFQAKFVDNAAKIWMFWKSAIETVEKDVRHCQNEQQRIQNDVAGVLLVSLLLILTIFTPFLLFLLVTLTMYLFAS